MKCTTLYAVRQSSKGWSGIICVAATHEAAEILCRQFYEDDARENEAREAMGSAPIRRNFRIEEIPFFENLPKQWSE